MCLSPNSGEAVALFEDRYGPCAAGGQRARLHELVARFSRLPYENLSKILHLAGQGAAPRLPRQVMTEHLELGTGGTCFSLTELLRQLCQAAGLTCYPVLAHMRHGAEIHCALRVEAAGGAYLVDPGYLLPEPLRLGRAEAPGDGRPFLRPAGSLVGQGEAPAGTPPGDFDLFTLEAEGPRWRYRFSDRPADRDRFLARWQQSFQQSGMRSLLATCRNPSGELRFLHNHKLRCREAGRGHRTVNVRQELEDAVRRTFGIHPDVTRRAHRLLREQREAYRRGQGRRG